MSKSHSHVVVIGGASGPGLASARLLAERGAAVTIVGRDRAKLDAAIAETPGCLFSATGPSTRVHLRVGGIGDAARMWNRECIRVADHASRRDVRAA